MTDELDILREVRATVAAPRSAARNAARARWDGSAAELGAAPAGTGNGARVFTMRAAVAAVVAFAVVAGAVLVTSARINSVKPAHVIAVKPLAQAAASDPQVFLLVGVDSRAFVQTPAEVQQFGDPAAIAGSRSDTMMLVRIDPHDGHVLVVSIPRDLEVDVPGHGTSKINAAYAYGGMQLLLQTITQDLGVPVNHVIEVDFRRFATLVDQLGGLRVAFPAPARDAFTGLDQPAGCVTLTGDQALGFVRSRHYEYYAGGRWQESSDADLGRVARQQLAIRQLAAAAESRVGTDPRPLLRALFADVTVDSGFTSDDALRYFDAMRGTHPTTALTLPVDVSGPAGLTLGAGAHPVLDALAGRAPLSAAVSGKSGPAPVQYEPVAC